MVMFLSTNFSKIFLSSNLLMLKEEIIQDNQTKGAKKWNMK